MADEYGLLIDHIHLRVRDLAGSGAFYHAVAEALGFRVATIGDHGVQIRELFLSDDGPPSGPVHIALRAGSQQAVRQFHSAATRAGGRDNGAPGDRQYHPGYFGAYVLDPDGNNVEAVYHGIS
jgi:predicted lactoylglutathione lyase